mgnify:CR=1 FL=1
MAATPWASDRNWELVFEDDFDGSSLNEHNWSRIDYVGYNAPDWRKYQSPVSYTHLTLPTIYSV